MLLGKEHIYQSLPKMNMFHLSTDPPLPRKDEIKMIDFSGIEIYLVICLAIITLNKHSTYYIGGLYAIGVHIIP